MNEGERIKEALTTTATATTTTTTTSPSNDRYGGAGYIGSCHLCSDLNWCVELDVNQSVCAA